MKKCAFLTLDEVGDHVIDDELAIAPLTTLGWQVSTLSWRQTSIPWRDFDIVIIRSTWDYWNDVPGFLATLERIERESLLANCLNLVRWNLVKTYLRDLEMSGNGIVPTLWSNSLDPGRFESLRHKLGTDNIVVKPTVGANGDDAYRISRDCPAARLADIAKRFDHRDCMIQPFMPNILNEGEYSLFFFSGQFSHAVLKTPAASEFRSQEEHGAEIRPILPQERLLLRAGQVMESLKPSPLYARVDLIRDAEDEFLVMELELIEPSMYLRMDAKAPDRFANAIEDWYQAAKSVG